MIFHQDVVKQVSKIEAIFLKELGKTKVRLRIVGE